MHLQHRRIVIMVLLAWFPLLGLSIAEGHFWLGSIGLPFLGDIELNMRLLIALPLLVAAEGVVHQRMLPIACQFVDRSVIANGDRAKFNDVITSAMNLRNSVGAEVLLAVLVYGVGVQFFWRSWVALSVASWYGVPTSGGLHMTLAGWWLGLVSLPLFQFLLLRWYFRILIWARFLWQVSRLKLDLMPIHPDRCGGISFLALCSQAFATVLLAQGVLLSGRIANRIFNTGAILTEFKSEISFTVAMSVLLTIGPLLIFLPQLSAARRKGLLEYGLLANRYAREFDHKWIRGGVQNNDRLMGSPDIQSMADMANSYGIVSEMRCMPFTLRTTLQLGLTTLLPVLPLLLTMIPLDELIVRLVKMVF